MNPIWHIHRISLFKPRVLAKPILVCGLLYLSIGCSSQPSAIRPPSFDPSAAAQAAIDEYDRNGDGQLQQSEWSASPALADSLDVYDTDSDNELSVNELAAGIRRWQEGGMGARPLPFQVRLGGRPLENAEVKLVPENFFGGAIKPATGTTRQGGRGYLGMAEEDLPPNAPNLPLVQPGLYRVEITHASFKIPARYNVKTTLGLEVADGRIDPRGVVWDLSR